MSDILKTLRTPSGTAFAMLPAQAGSPAPTLLLFAMAGTDTLSTEPYCRVGRLLHAQGWSVALLDLPCYGSDRRAGRDSQADAIGRKENATRDSRRGRSILVRMHGEKGLAFGFKTHAGQGSAVS